MSRIQIVGVDLVGMFGAVDSSLGCLQLVEASLRTWRPQRSFDLITCVHGMHYLGDKLGVIAGATSWLSEGGLFVANLDINNLRLTGNRSQRKLLAGLNRAGLEYDRKQQRVSCRGQKRVDIPFRYLGADDQAGPNSTGQPAVNSHYDFIDDRVPPRASL